MVLHHCAVLAVIMRKEGKVPENPVISIVDDDLSVREATTDLIKAMGFDVEAFKCADDFLASDLCHSTSCLIADMRMPGMSGLELHNRLAEAGTPIPTILITAFPNDRDQAHALRSGVVGYLTKPFNETELLTLIHSVLKYPKNGERNLNQCQRL
jgi:FixJ family two-component response regulator